MAINRNFPIDFRRFPIIGFMTDADLMELHSLKMKEEPLFNKSTTATRVSFSISYFSSFHHHHHLLLLSLPSWAPLQNPS